jgi:hypothetical protein
MVLDIIESKEGEDYVVGTYISQFLVEASDVNVKRDQRLN